MIKIENQRAFTILIRVKGTPALQRVITCHMYIPFCLLARESGPFVLDTKTATHRRGTKVKGLRLRSSLRKDLLRLLFLKLTSFSHFSFL